LHYRTGRPFVFQRRTFSLGDVRRKRKTRWPLLVSPLPRGEGVPESQKKRSVQQEPVVLWRMQRPGMRSHSVISPRPDGAIVVWYVNGRAVGFKDFGDWTSALRWSDQLRAQNWSTGWRLD
jgi:hypothetical protein